MKVFLSHSSRDQALVREVKGLLPDFLNTWLDEDSLCWGDFPGATKVDNSVGHRFSAHLLEQRCSQLELGHAGTRMGDAARAGAQEDFRTADTT